MLVFPGGLSNGCTRGVVIDSMEPDTVEWKLVLLVPIRAFQEALFPLHPQMEDVWEKVLECALHRRGSELELEVFLLVFLRTSLAPNSDHWEIPTLSFFWFIGSPPV